MNKTGRKVSSLTSNDYNVAQYLPKLLADPAVMHGIGSITFTRPDETSSKLYLENGQVYVVEHLNYERNLWSELVFEDRLQHSNLRALLRSNRSQRESLYKLLKKARAKNEKTASTLQEYLLGAMDDIYQWEQVQTEWRLGEEFPHESARTPIPLSRLINTAAARAVYKYEKYTEWGFKDDTQFLYGTVVIKSKKTDYEATSKLQELFLEINRFVIKNVQESTGYSLYSIVATLDELEKTFDIVIENPAGFHEAKALIMPEQQELLNNGPFADNDEDADVRTTFNQEYSVPEPARLSEIADNADEKHSSYNEVIDDTTSLEIPKLVKLPPLPKPDFTSFARRKDIPESELQKEIDAQQDLADLYDTTPTTPSETSEEAENMTDILELAKALQRTLKEKQTDIEQLNQTIVEKEAEVTAARSRVTQKENELDQLIYEREQASTAYEEAVALVNTFK